jgi:hypothetical protein
VQLTLAFDRVPIPGYPKYAIDKHGNIYGCKGQPLKGFWVDGYHKIYLGDRYHYVHRLVLQTFVGACPEGFQACHKNSDRADNRLSNLVWGSRKRNAQDRKKLGYCRLGLNIEQKQRAQYLYEVERWSFDKLHKEFKIDARTIRRYAKKYNWQRQQSLQTA